jgi:hypothetical protein
MNGIITSALVASRIFLSLFVGDTPAASEGRGSSRIFLRRVCRGRWGTFWFEFVKEGVQG